MRALIAVLALAAAPAGAEAPAEPACANVRVALPAALSGWAEQTPVTAGLKPGDGATLAIGRAVLASLHPAGQLGFATPAKAAAGANGGTLAMGVSKPGTYKIALGDAAWVDLIRDGKPVASKAHGHGPPCSGIRKIVDFALTPGTYALQLSGSAADTLAVMVARAG